MAIIELTPQGLYCPAGDFHIDPWRPVPRAVITHGHADHARPGNGLYFAEASGAPILRHRLGADIQLQPLAYGESLSLGRARISLHPAGHILGSAQVRVEVDGEVWVATGDFKRDSDPTCTAFEPVACDTLITEATFALPIYRWPSMDSVAADIFHWWQHNAAQGRASVLFCYALGKAQRVLAALRAHTDQRVLLHGAVVPLTEIYRDAGIAMLPTLPALDFEGDRKGKQRYAGELVIAPPGANGTAWMKRFGDCGTGFCSGWMLLRGNHRRRGYDRGFVMSDHADWPSLLSTIEECGATRVLATHGRSDTLVRYLRERGQSAAELQTEFDDAGIDDASDREATG
ncbi:MAG: ligase-associated DNA damage response exonuclease [Halieaceae bacterium]|nr:ligase-associated DNA damage response exonuclease [Halieaceae bacterium]